MAIVPEIVQIYRPDKQRLNGKSWTRNRMLLKIGPRQKSTGKATQLSLSCGWMCL